MVKQSPTSPGASLVIRDVARQLRDMREKWNMSREDLAEVSGVCARTISEIESNSRAHEASIRTICNMADAMGCDIVVELKFRG